MDRNCSFQHWQSALEPLPTMRVSIITACLNPGASMTRTVDSIASQRYRDLEWIVVDGGSQDGTPQLAMLGARPPDKLISEPDEGIAHAFNKGLQHATGEAVWFMNAGDEFSSPDSISGLVDDWDRARFRWITGASEIVAVDGSVLFTRRWKAQPRNAMSLVRWNCQISHQAVLAEKSLFTELGGFDQSFRIAMDYELWLRWIKGGVVPQCSPRVVCRFHRGGASGEPIKNHLDERKARTLHGLELGPLGETLLASLAWLKTLIRGRYGRSIYRLKEHLGIRI